MTMLNFLMAMKVLLNVFVETVTFSEFFDEYIKFKRTVFI